MWSFFWFSLCHHPHVQVFFCALAEENQGRHLTQNFKGQAVTFCKLQTFLCQVIKQDRLENCKLSFIHFLCKFQILASLGRVATQLCQHLHWSRPNCRYKISGIPPSNLGHQITSNRSQKIPREIWIDGFGVHSSPKFFRLPL